MESEKIPTDAQEAGAHVRSGMIGGFKAIGTRFLFSLFLRAISVLTLSRILTKNDYGLVGIVTAIAGLGVYFSDFGMGSALVQKEEEPSDSETTTVFWCQQVFTGGIIVCIVAGMPWLLSWFNAPQSARWLLISMAFGLWLSSLRIVPVIFLERQLKFTQQARCEMLESAVQLAVSIVLGVLGVGAWALIGGSLVGRAVGLIAVWFASPWRPRGRFDGTLAKRIWRQGLPFQLNAVLPQLVNFPSPMLLSRSFGPGGLGLINWSGNIASTPLMLSGMLNRIAFPAFSRLQSHPEELGRVAGESTQRLGTVLALLFSPIVLIAPILIPLFFGEKWVEGTGLFRWSMLEALLAIMANLLAQVLPAAGYVTQALKFQIPMGLVRLVALWIGIRVAGINGVGPANYATSLIILFIYAYISRQAIPNSKAILVQSFKPVFTLHAFVGIALFIAWKFVPGSSNIVQVATALAVWATCVGLYDMLSPEHPIRSEISSLLRMVNVRRAVPVVSAP